MRLRARLPWLVFVALLSCDAPVPRFLGVPTPLSYDEGGLLSIYGEALTSMDGRCGVDPADNPAEPPGSPRMLLDLATPLSVVSSRSGRPAQPFPHGQVQINATDPATDGQGTPRFRLCDVPLLRGNQDLEQFRWQRRSVTGAITDSGPLGGVLGGDMFTKFSLTLSFSAKPDGTPTAPELILANSDITPSCFLSDAVLPFVPEGGGDQMVLVGDAIVTYPPTRITIAACVEPLEDPLVLGRIKTCVDASKFAPNELAPICADLPNQLVNLGNIVDDKHYRDPAYEASGANMRFLLSTAVPDLILSQTACRQLASPERCDGTDSKRVVLRLPGLDTVAVDDPNVPPEQVGWEITLGGNGHAALALVARQFHLSPCAELARSRRQRYAFPSAPPDWTQQSQCLREACLQDLTRQSEDTLRRCGYTGMEVEKACDDHEAPVAPYVEIGGSSDDRSFDDKLTVVVVPDSSRVLQSANADLRNTTAQVDGVIGVSLLTRLHLTVDGPQQRILLSCRCGLGPNRICRTYRGVNYHDADDCVPDSNNTGPPALIPADYGRTVCR